MHKIKNNSQFTFFTHPHHLVKYSVIKTGLIMAMIVCVFLFPTQRLHAAETEAFDSVGGYKSNGWSTFISPDAARQGNAAGWVHEARAGGHTGEAFVNFRRTTGLAYFADTDLAGTFNSYDAMSATGKINIIEVTRSQPDFGSGVYIGFFNANPESPPSGVGLVVRELKGQMTWGLSLGSVHATRVDPRNTIELDVQRTFSLNWDPNIGYGRLTGSISGAGSPMVLYLTEAERAAMDRQRGFDAFGMVIYPTDGIDVPRGADFRIDDVSYTHGETQ